MRLMRSCAPACRRAVPLICARIQTLRHTRGTRAVLSGQLTMSADVSAKHLFHLAPAEALQSAQASGQAYTPATYEQDGFIHLTGDPQLLLSVGNHFYRSSPGDWLLLVLDTTALTAKVVWEPAAPVGTTGPPTGAEQKLFPHLYGPLNLDAVVAELPVLRDSEGAFLQIQGLEQYSGHK